MISAEGIWVREGYGEAMEVTSAGVRFFQFNSKGCLSSFSLLALYLRLSSDVLPISEVETKLEKVELLDNGQRLVIGARGATSSYDQFYSRRDSLPAECSNGLDYSVNPVEVFEYFWQHVDQYYSFLELRGVDWQALYQRFRPQVSLATTDDELFVILSEMLKPLKDAHVSLESDGNWFNTENISKFYQHVLDSEQKLRDQGLSDEQIQQASQQLFMSYLVQKPSEYLTKEEIHVVRDFYDEPLVVWGKTPDNIGLIKLMQVEAFAQENATPAQEVNAVKQLMNEVMASLQDTRAMVIDLRYNTGGHDIVSTTIASYFADIQKVVYRKRVENKDATTDWIDIYVTPVESAYLNPVFVVTSQDTISGAETLTLALKAYDHVTQIGEKTQGALSDILPTALPNGWYLTLSNELYVNTLGESFEGEGVPPQVRLPLFKGGDVTQPILPLDYVRTQLKNTH